MREAARGGGLFSIRRAARGSGDGEAAQLALSLRPHRSNAIQLSVITPYPLV
jgi:hypothetical protein